MLLHVAMMLLLAAASIAHPRRGRLDHIQEEEDILRLIRLLYRGRGPTSQEVPLFDRRMMSWADSPLSGPPGFYGDYDDYGTLDGFDMPTMASRSGGKKKAPRPWNSWAG